MCINYWFKYNMESICNTPISERIFFIILEKSVPLAPNYIMRYKEYNKNKVLEHAVNLFWENGFRGASIRDLVELTGVNRFSLYHEFTDKEGILYNSLKLYRERYCQQHLDLLNQQGSLEEILQGFLQSFLEEDRKWKGCYFIHIGTEMADSDPRIKEIVKEFMIELEGLMNDILIRHQIEPEISRKLSRHLVSHYCTSMSFCLIHSKEQRERHISNGIKVILQKKENYA